MKPTRISEKSPRRSISFLFFFLLFAYPLISFLWRRSYPFLTIETGILFAVVLAASVVLSSALSTVRQSIAGVLTSFLITISLMVQFNLLIEGAIICLATCLMLAWLLKANLQVYGVPVLVALILGALVDGVENDGSTRSAGEPVSVNTELPPVIHILLDAFTGLDGLPPYPSSALMREELTGFFKDYGFQVFPRAYSRYSATGDSLYSAMNFKNDGSSKFVLEVVSRRKHVLESNELFNSLEETGYRINVYQTGHIDLCRSNPTNLDKCWQYEHPNVRSLRHVKDRWLRATNLAGVMLKQSTLLTDFFKPRGWFIDIGITNHDPKIFTHLTSDIMRGADGRYFFAHVLLPHSPYAYMYDCSINYAPNRMLRYPTSIREPVRDPLVYEARAGMYFQQVECALNSLREIFDEMKKTDLFDRSTIVLHGDHGALGRYVAKYKNQEKLTPADYRANFSTLFAIKSPHGSYQVSEETLSLGVLLEEVSRTIEEQTTGMVAATPGLQVSTSDPEKLGKYVFLWGTRPLHRVDIDIFEN